MSAARNDNSRLVYSTDGGRLPAEKERRQRRQPATAPQPSVPDDGIVRVMRSKSGRKGKTVTLVTGLPGNEADLQRVLKDLKQRCGTGGALEGRTLAIQGDQRERLAAELEKMGHRVKLAGG